jgi:hypothetical protein
MRTGLAVILALGAAATTSLVGAGGQTGPAAASTRQASYATVDLSAPVSADLLVPEGKSRWDLTGVRRRGSFVRTLAETPGAVEMVDARNDAPVRILYGVDVAAGPTDSDPARRWLMPDLYPEMLRPGARSTLEFSAEGSGPARRLRAEVETVGIGWIHLPSGPREVVLQRALLRDGGPEGQAAPRETLIHRWIDPRAGVVAEVSRDPSARGPSALSGAIVLEQVLLGAATLKIYVDELDSPPFSGIAFGWDKGAGTAISSLTPQAYPNFGALIAADTWDFSQNTSGTGENTSTGVPLTAAETCNFNQCGYGLNGPHPNRFLSREDKTILANGTLMKTNAVTERQTNASDVLVWLRSGAQNEGVSGSLGSGESHFCYASDDGTTRTPVPIWRFPNQDALGFYMQPGDAPWSSAPFNCEQNLYNEVCGGGGTFSHLYAKGCAGQTGTHLGTQSGQVLKGGVVVLPSGHTFNALLVKTIADFCVYLGSGCSAFVKVDEVRTFVYLWQVPVIGTVVRLNSAQNVTDGTTPTTVAETDIKFGLFPPLSITATGSTDTTVSLSWDPGRDTHRIGGYKVYWGTSSGSGAPYPFDSARNPSQAAFAGTSATISGLSPGTSYFFTVTSLSSFRDPSTGVTTQYESLIYPTQISGDPAFVYPIEVRATTTGGGTCIPTAEVTGLTVQHATGAIQICWQPVSDPCLQGYDVLGASSPTAAANFSVVAQTGAPETCWTGNPAAGFFLVVARGTGGSGPWGAYGR